MLLSMDVGNTQTVMGVFDGDELVSQWRISTNPLSTSDEIRAVIMPLLDADGISTSLIGQAVIASVVPQLEQAWRTAVKMIFQTDLLSCSAETAKDLIKISYPRPKEIGADRIADAVAAFHMYGAPVMVVDFGTATNIEVVDREGYFLGGAIAPGLQTSATALNHRGALLPQFELVAPPGPIGKSTVEAMQSGVILGEALRIDGLVKLMSENLGYEPRVIATGGLAPLVVPYAKTVTDMNLELTLEGLRMIAENNFKEKPGDKDKSL